MRAHRPILGLALVLAASLIGASPVLAANGLSDTANQTYTLNPGAGRVDVVIDVTIRNTKASTTTYSICVTPESYPYTTSCANTTRHYVDATSVWVENNAVNLKASADSGNARLSLVQRVQGFSEYKVSFVRTYGGSTRKLRITYQLPGGAPRSASDTRIGPAFASFCAGANGFDGGSTRIVIPAGFEVENEVHGGTLTESKSGSTSVWTTGNLADTDAFWACFSGENPAGFTSSTVRAGARSIDLQAWPGDPVWLETVSSEATTAIVQLEQLIGRPLPGTGPLVVRESASGSLGAYAGSFNPNTGVARIGEEVETGVVAHELAHVWFNNRLFQPTWLSEGSASWAESTITGDACAAPGAYPETAPPSLADWRFAGPRSTVEDLNVVAWQYDAACFIVASVASKLGPDRMRTVLASLIDGTSAYRPGATDLALKTTGATLRQWLDAVDELGMVPAGIADLDFAQDLLEMYGASVDSGELGQRSATRALYHALRSAVGPWQLPPVVVRAMGLWNFDQAGSAITRASKAHEYVTRADTALPEASVFNGAVRTLFEGATDNLDVDKLGLRAFDQFQAAELVAAAKARVEGPREAATALGVTPSGLAAELAAAVSAVTQADLDAATGAVALIDTRLADEQKAAALVATVAERLGGSLDPLARVGLLGTDAQPTLTAARAAVGAIDLEAARMHVAAVDKLLADAPVLGAIRLGVVLVLILGAAIAVLTLRRRRRIRAADVPVPMQPAAQE
jgi:hypothetical protein